MKRVILCILAIALILMMISTINVFAATGIVNTETLNLRKEASTDSEVIELLNEDAEIEIISEEGEWYNVKHGNNTGYVKKEYIKVKEGTISINEVSNTVVNNTPSENDTNENTEIENTVVDNETTTVSNTNSVSNVVTTATKLKLIPSINANEMEEITVNSEVEIITKTNNWAFIQYNNMTGWIPLVALEEVNNEVEKEEEIENTENEEETTETTEETVTETESGTTYENSVTKYVNTSSINLRSKPSTDSEVLTSLIKDTDVKVIGEDGDWYKVTYGKYTGYIRKDLLSDTSSVTSRGGVEREETVEEVSATTSNGIGDEIVAYAKQYLGCPYVYGGSGSSSFDCSGFTMYVYKHFGYSLSHSATAQSYLGSYVSKENLQPGDLVFFLDYETMDGIGHVGIYIGDGQFIHASSGSGYCVKISDLTTGSYLRRYSTARRLY